MGGWGITSLIPNLSTRWTSVVNFVPQLLQPRKELCLPIEQEAVWAPEQAWTF